METKPDAIDSPEPPLHRAARLGDLIALERLLAEGADINAPATIVSGSIASYTFYCYHVTPLMVAARSVDGASVATLRWLLDNGAELDPQAAWYAAGRGGRERETPWTPPEDQTERLRFLLDAGLDPNQQEGDRPDLLVEACAAGSVGNVRLLLERGVVPDASMLFEAADSGSAECVALLLDYGLDPNVTQFLGGTPLNNAGSAEVVRVLLARGARLDAKGDHGADLLTAVLDRAMDGEVCFLGRAAAAQALLGAGIEPQHDCLFHAAFRYQADAVDWFLARGISLESAPDSMAPLHAVCWQSQGGSAALGDSNLAPAACEQIICSLVAAGSSPDLRDDIGSTPLHYAIDGDGLNCTAVRILLELGASADAINNDGDTPLHWAAHQEAVALSWPGNGHTGYCCALLLERGADPLRPDKTGKTPFARVQQHWENARQACEDDAPVGGITQPRLREYRRKVLANATQLLELFQRYVARR